MRECPQGMERGRAREVQRKTGRYPEGRVQLQRQDIGVERDEVQGVVGQRAVSVHALLLQYLLADYGSSWHKVHHVLDLPGPPAPQHHRRPSVSPTGSSCFALPCVLPAPAPDWVLATPCSRSPCSS